MPFDNYYPNRKDWRKPYRGSANIFRSCRNHGSCDHCTRSRTFQALRLKSSERADKKVREDLLAE